jgi:AcrR family transcriptional regulator
MVEVKRNAAVAVNAQSAPKKEKADGRKQRSARSRDKIKASIVALINAGNYSPRAIDISKHSGLSMRTVFRHIDDMEALTREIAGDMQKELLPLFLKPYKSSSWREQLDEKITRRAEIWEHILPIRLSGSLRRFRSKFPMDEYRQLLELERASLQSVLPDDLVADDVLFQALNEAMGVGFWINLRMDQELSPDATEAVMRRTVDALINSANS